jgi:hypothetical protein
LAELLKDTSRFELLPVTSSFAATGADANSVAADSHNRLRFIKDSSGELI